jgi:hypothetical protein
MLIYNNVDRYKDASKTLFKSSTRLECMMQDYPRTLAPSAKVGFTVSPISKAVACLRKHTFSIYS